MPETTYDLLPLKEECLAERKKLGDDGVPAVMLFIAKHEPDGDLDDVIVFRTDLAALLDWAAGKAVNDHYINPTLLRRRTR